MAPQITSKKENIKAVRHWSLTGSRPLRHTYTIHTLHPQPHQANKIAESFFM